MNKILLVIFLLLFNLLKGESDSATYLRVLVTSRGGFTPSEIDKSFYSYGVKSKVGYGVGIRHSFNNKSGKYGLVLNANVLNKPTYEEFVYRPSTDSIFVDKVNIKQVALHTQIGIKRNFKRVRPCLSLFSHFNLYTKATGLGLVSEKMELFDKNNGLTLRQSFDIGYNIEIYIPLDVKFGLVANLSGGITSNIKGKGVAYFSTSFAGISLDYKIFNNRKSSIIKKK